MKRESPHTHYKRFFERKELFNGTWEYRDGIKFICELIRVPDIPEAKSAIATGPRDGIFERGPYKHPIRVSFYDVEMKDILGPVAAIAVWEAERITAKRTFKAKLTFRDESKK